MINVSDESPRTHLKQTNSVHKSVSEFAGGDETETEFALTWRNFRRIANRSQRSKLKLWFVKTMIEKVWLVGGSEIIGLRGTASQARGGGRRSGFGGLGANELGPLDQGVNNSLSWGHVELCGPLFVDKCELARASFKPSDWMEAEKSGPFVWYLARSRSDSDCLIALSYFFMYTNF